MLVQEIRKISSRKAKILLEDGNSFVLYLGEVRRFAIAEGEDLPDRVLDEIQGDVLAKRAKLRCMYLLKASDRTEDQLRRRLKQDGYPEEIIREALSYVASFHYTDDRRYAENYYRQMSGKKSRRQIESDLMARGVDRDLISAVFEEFQDESDGEDPEEAAIRAIAAKRHYDPDTAGPEETAKILRYLVSKGFGYSTIRRALGAGSISGD